MTQRFKTLTLPTVFLRDRILLPHAVATLFIGRDRSLAALNASAGSENLLFFPLQKRQSNDQPNIDGIYRFGVVGHVIDNKRLPDGTCKISLEIKFSGELIDCTLKETYWTSTIRPVTHNEKIDNITKALSHLSKAVRKHKQALKSAIVERLHATSKMNVDQASKEVDDFFEQDSQSAISALLTKDYFTVLTDFSTKRLSARGQTRGDVSGIVTPTLSSLVFDEYKSRATPVQRRMKLKTTGPKKDVTEALKAATANLAFSKLLTFKSMKKASPKTKLAEALDHIISQSSLPNRTKQTLLGDGRLDRTYSLVMRHIELDLQKLQSRSATPDDAPRIFVSHSNADKKRIKPIILGLLGAGLQLFIDRPSAFGLSDHPQVRGIGSGPFRKELSQALKSSSCVLALWSVQATEGHRTELHEEASFGKDHGILVQVAIDDFDDVYEKLPLGFKEWQLFDLNVPLHDRHQNYPIDVSLLVREINDVIRRNPNTNAPMAAWKQASAAVGMAVVHEQLRTLPKPPPPAPTVTYSSLDDLRKRMLSQAKTIASRLAGSNHYMEQDIAAVLQAVIHTFDHSLDEIDLTVAPSVGEMLIVLRETYKDASLRNEIANHVFPALRLAASAYESFVSKWGAWTDQQQDPAREWVTPENADRTREAADIVIQFASSARVVHESVPEVLIALRQLIRPALAFSRFNEYRYLNAIGEGLRACWNEGERYINGHWAELQDSISNGGTPNIGPFNDFFLEMADALIQLSRANSALFGWLFVRVGYLKRVKAGTLIVDSHDARTNTKI